MERTPHVVIVGGGFGGLYAARALRRAPVRVTLLDRRNHHVFQPLLYQVATAALSPSEIAAPIRAILRRQKNCTVLMAEARSIDVAGKRIVLSDGEVAYDFLILATGATHSYFGHDEWAPFAPGLKTLEDALQIRRKVLLAYEAAEREPDEALRREWLTFVIVGGGATGVELAGALAEIAHYTLRRDFRQIDPSEARVILVEARDRVLPPYPPELSAKAERSLDRLRVEVVKNVSVTGIDERGVTLGTERLPARTVLWAAGVAASPLAKSLGVPLDRAGRVLVGPHLEAPGRDDVFVIGDLAHVEQGGAPVPGVAPAAMQMGTYVATTIARTLRGRERRPFRYFEKGTFAVIGRGEAVGMPFGKLRIAGFLAWVAWLFIHIFFLIGFRNRLLVMFGWAYSYVTFRRGARLITGESGPPPISDGVRPSPPPPA
jgi:NADH:ubiquinone reductase (H+-translocating)